MGTATFIIHHTRSQNRKTRSASKGELKDRELSSPLEAIHGNILIPSSKRRCLRPTNASTAEKSSDKENVTQSSTGVRDASQVWESEGAAKTIKKRTDSGEAANHSRRYRSRPENSKEDDVTTPAKGSSSTLPENECENEGAAPLAAFGSHGLLNQKPTRFASSPVNRTNLGTMPDVDTGFCTRSSQDNYNDRSSLATRDSASPVGTNGERKFSVYCTENEKHDVPRARLEAGFLGSLAGTDGERESSAGCTVTAKISEAHTLRPQPGKDSKDTYAFQITDFDHNVGSSLPGASPLLLLKKDYEKLYQKYQKLKARRFDEVDALFKEQNSRITAYIRATEALMDHYKGENNALKHQIQDTNIPDVLNRCRQLEKANVQCRNDVLLEQAKNLELQQEIECLKSLCVERVTENARNSSLGSKLTPRKHEDSAINIGKIEDRTKRKMEDDAAPVLRNQTKLMQQLLEGLLGLKLRFCDDGIGTQLQFQHDPTGFSFKLQSVQDVDIALLVGGGELMYQNVSSGTLRSKGADWMKEDEFFFGIAQVQFLFKKLLRFFQQGA